MALDPTEFAAAMATYLAAHNLSIAMRRGLAAAVPATLRQGESFFATDSGSLFVGNGDGSEEEFANINTGASVYVTKDAATDSTFNVTFPKNVTSFMLFATWDSKKILNVGRYVLGVDQNSVSNANDSGLYTFNSTQIGVLYLDGANYVVLSCSALGGGIATIVQAKTGTCTGTLRLFFIPA